MYKTGGDKKIWPFPQMMLLPSFGISFLTYMDAKPTVIWTVSFAPHLFPEPAFDSGSADMNFYDYLINTCVWKSSPKSFVLSS